MSDESGSYDRREPLPPDGLREVQDFLAGVFQRREPVVGDARLSEACASHVSGNERMTPAEQVDVYRHQFWLRHRAALLDDYPGFAYVIGDDAFDAFARAYLVAHVPHTPSLRELGARSVEFAASYPHFAPETRELALDMLAYELAWVDVFDGPDPAPLDPSLIAAVPAEAWNTALVRLNPCVARLALHHPVHRLRYSVKAGESPELPARVDDGVRLALFRTSNVLHFEELSPDAFGLLDALGHGVPLVPACAALTDGKSDEAIAELNGAIGGWFSSWARWGFIAAIELPERVPSGE